MNFHHNELAHSTIRELLAQLRRGKASWSTNRLTAKTTYWQGISDWPCPDGAFEDRSTGSSLAIEFKPPGRTKREYVTGLGQALTYLDEFEYAVLVVPKLANDKYEIAKFLKSCLKQPFLSALPLGLFTYDADPGDPNDLRPIVKLRNRKKFVTSIPKGMGRKVFWAYWRDLSPHDLFVIIETMDSGKKDYKQAFQDFWEQYMVTGRAQNWEGNYRKKKGTNPRSFSSELSNTRMSLRHIGIINSSGNLTEAGYNLVHCGKVYGPSSKAFMSQLARYVLGPGKHLELIFWVDEQQRTIPGPQKVKAILFYRALDQCLQKAGIIARLPSGKGKASFFRDEPKLWNKLGFLDQEKGKYFTTGTGLTFNWRKIVSTIR